MGMLQHKENTSGLQKIGDLAVKYQVSSRTLRYYEEVGLLASTRLGDSQYRYYDEKAVSRLEQIMTLKKLQLPIKDIREILSSQDIEVALDAFTRKLRSLEEDIESMNALKGIIQDFLALLKEKGYKHASGLQLLQDEARALVAQLPDYAPELDASDNSSVTKKRTPLKKDRKGNDREELTMLNNNVIKLTDNDVRLIKLQPMRVAYYRHISTSPEGDAWDVMNKWVKAKGLDQLFSTRYFGFDNPSPKEGQPEYGYEVWVNVSDDVEESGEIKIKDVPGGLYAVTTTFGPEIPQRWRALVQWVKDGNKYGMAHQQCLEEHLVSDDVSNDFEVMQLDLYLPVRKK